jgi:hypothetical protein
MNTSTLKSYAPQARRDFIQAVTDRAAFYGLRKEGSKLVASPMTESGDSVLISGRAFPKKVGQQRRSLEKRIASDGFDQTIEAVAYTWFNRLIAIRFMEVRGYLDHGYRVLSHPDGGPTPEALLQAEHLDLPGLKKSVVVDLKLAGNRDGELYRLLLTAQCDALNRAMPFLFGRIDDETELLLPDNLLHSDSLIRKLVASVTDEDCESVEVLGWLYQFYIAERKDEVMARKSAVPTEDIPAVTQLFTPHWIVRYLVENSLGRLWLLNRPHSRLREHMPYYIEGEPETDYLKISSPEEIKVVDPACGSGHMLTYAFDLLVRIYEEAGYAPSEIPGLILKHNLHGLEICPRAAQLAELALIFKARETSRRFLQQENLIRPHIMELRDVQFKDNELSDYIRELKLGGLFERPVLELLRQFEEAKNFGSLIQPCLDERAIVDLRKAIEAKDLGGQLFLRETHLKVLRVLEQAEALTQRYHVVVANPPYLASGGMNASLKDFARSQYPTEKSDLFAMFIRCGFALVAANGFVAMVTMDAWMFLPTCQAMRESLLDTFLLRGMVHMPYLGKGGTPMGINFGTAAMIWSKSAPAAAGAQFQCIRYFECDDDFVPKQFPTINERYGKAAAAMFRKIPGSPIAYHAGEATIRAFEEMGSISDFCETASGLQTSDNQRFLRQWYEIDIGMIEFGARSKEDSLSSSRKWYPHKKGGPVRRWYGNNDFVLNWKQGGEELYEFARALYGSPTRIIKNTHLYFREGVTWSHTTTSFFSARLLEPGFIFNVEAPSVFGPDTKVMLSFLCSVVGRYLIELTNPTLHFVSKSVGCLPFDPTLIHSIKASVVAIADSCVDIARADWDNFETSWDFRDQPLLRPGLKGATLEASWRNWEAQSTAAIRRMQELETENNRLFIAAYGLDGELQPEVPEEQITLVRADARRDMAAFLSYAVGCMMGRYSPYNPGLILANAGDSLREFLERVGKPMAELNFAPDEDGIIPVLDSERFDDDVVARTRAFLRATFGDATLEDNVRFIEDTLGKPLRKYFLSDFFKEHLKTYKKRPIYWLFSSGKEKAFQALVYLHRYNTGTLARMRTEYVIPLQGQLASRIEQLEDDKARATSTSHRRALQKEQDTLRKQQAELLRFDEKLRHVADQRISLNLDDGVKVNYGKFGDLLAEVDAVTGGGDE